MPSGASEYPQVNGRKYCRGGGWGVIADVAEGLRGGCRRGGQPAVPRAARRLVPYATGSPGSFAIRVRRLTGIEGFHVHQIRHTFACQWPERGGSLAALQQVLGHASITTTQRYAKLSDEAVMREALRMDAHR